MDFVDPMSSWWPYIIAAIVGVITAFRAYMGGVMCPSPATVSGKVIIITGGNSGIGFETALELARRGGQIILACRNIDLAVVAADKIRQQVKNAYVRIMVLDLTSLVSIRAFISHFNERHVDILINNAGIMWHPFEKTVDGFEMHFVTNYLGHFLLTQLLLPKLKKAVQGKIINVSALAHFASDITLTDLNREMKFIPREAYGQSKLALVLMATKMAKLLEGTKVTINSLHPGLVRDTGIFRKSPFSTSTFIKFSMYPWVWLFMKTPVQGAQTSIFLAVAPVTVSGQYFSDCEMQSPSKIGQDEDLAEKLYDASMALVGL